MAKIRVYELARELNMTNKELIDKISQLDISVKSHMSALEDDTVDYLKSKLLGKQGQDVEETRIRPTVIRRRRKRVPEAPLQADSAVEPEVETPAAAEEEEAVEEVSAASEPAVQEEAQAEAEPVSGAGETVEVAEEEAPPAEPVAEEPAPGPEEPVSPEAEAEAAPEETPAAAKEAKPAAEPEKPPVIKKIKPRTETPARIIRLPETPEPEEVEAPSPEPETAPPEKPAEARPAGKAQPPARKADETRARIIERPATVESEEAKAERDKKKKKGKKKGEKAEVVEEPSRDKRFFKKKISFPRKEVVEGADLYDSDAARGRKGRKGGARTKQVPAAHKPNITTPKAIKRRVKVDETIVLADLAKRMGIKASEMIKKLMTLGVMATVNQTIDFETASLVASEFNYEVEKASFEEEEFFKAEADTPETLKTRPPVVTVMGHVDHGKTSLLDVIRKTRVTEGEAGGITQHIGAYYVKTDNGQIVFLDTPGHEAFTAMRARGAKVTDIVVLVVAADDGVMPQTVEAINHSRAAGVPIIVAVNKMDKAGADPDKVQRQLADLGLIPEDWGGDTIYVKVSAKQNQGLDELLEMILLQTEVLELKANPDKPAKGTVVEAKLDTGRGPVATILVQEGTLHTGDSVVCGMHHGKVRAMLNDRGVQVDTAGPSVPVEVLGLAGVPMAGDELIATADEKSAKQVSEHRLQKQRSLELAKTNRLSLEGLFEKMQQGEVQELNLILKADVHGSIEALKDSLTKLSTEEVKINVIHSATGTIHESDVSLAAVSDAIILGFNVRPNAKVADMAQEENVDMRFYNVIYDAIQDVKKAIVGLTPSTFEERILGRAEVRQVFHVPKVGNIAGCYVTDGKMERNQSVRLLREGIILYSGKISSLKRYKDDAKEVQSGYECGIGIENYNDIKVGDVVECYYMEEIKPELGA